MPYRRRTRLQTPLLSWTELTLLDARDGWSDAYQVASPRMVLPGSHWLGCATARRQLLADALTPLWLDPDEPYRLQQPWAGQRSVLIALHERPPAPARRLDAAALLRLAQLQAALAAGPVDTLAVEEQLLGMIQTAAVAAGPEGTRAERAVRRARECLAADPGSTAGLAELARACATSPFHLARRFRAGTGLSLHAYRTRLRMAQALQRLRGGESDLSALALDLGYCSQSHFGAVFRRHFGTAPGRLRAGICARI